MSFDLTTELALFLQQFIQNGGMVLAGTGSPEGVVGGQVGWLYTRLDGGGLLYKKATGTGTTGWVDVSTGTASGGVAAPAQVRLTTETGVPVSTMDRTAQGTLYATPSTANGWHLDTATVRTWTGAAVRTQTFSGDKSLALSVVTGAVQDIFLKDSDLSLVAEYWKNATITVTIANPAVVTWTSHGLATGDKVVFSTTGALPTGMVAGTKYLVAVTGVDTFRISSDYTTAVITTGSQSGVHTGYVISVGVGNTTQPRTLPLAVPAGSDLVCSGTDNTRLYLGSILATGANVTADSEAARYVVNAHNQMIRRGYKADIGSHTCTSTAFQYWNTDTSYKIEGLIGGPTQWVWHNVTGYTVPGAGDNVNLALGFEWTSGHPGDPSAFNSFPTLGTELAYSVSATKALGAIGYRYFSVVERSLGGTTATLEQMTATVNWWT